MTNWQLADLAAAKFVLRAVEKGLVVSRPITETGVRYDFILDDGGELLRVQVKGCDADSSNTTGAVQVCLRISRNGRVSKRHYTGEEVDLIVVYLPRLDKLVGLRPEHFAGKSFVSLRFVRPQNKQANRRNILWVDKLVW